MVDFRIDERVTMRGETFVVVGVTPASVVPRLVQLENPETGERVDVTSDELAQSFDHEG